MWSQTVFVSHLHPLGGSSTNPRRTALSLFFSVYHHPSLPLRNHGGPWPVRENPPGGFGIDCGLIRAQKWGSESRDRHIIRWVLYFLWVNSETVAFHKDNRRVVLSYEACVVVEQDWLKRMRKRIRTEFKEHHLTGLICVSHRNNRQAFSWSHQLLLCSSQWVWRWGETDVFVVYHGICGICHLPEWLPYT